MQNRHRQLPPFVMKFCERTQAVLETLVEPPASIELPKDRHHARLLNSLLVVFSPLVLAAAFLYVPSTATSSERSFGFGASMAGVGLLLSIYLLSRRGFYRFAIWFVFIVGYMILVANTIWAGPPYVSFSYFVLLTLFTNILFSLRATILSSLIVLLSIAILGYALPDRLPNEPQKYLTFAFVIQAFIIFVTYHRNRFEADRSLKLQQNEEKLRLLVEQLPVAVWTMDRDLNITSVQGKGLSDTLLSEGKLISGLQTDVDRSHYEALFKDALAGSPVTFNLNWEGVPYEHHVEPLKNRDGEIVGCIGVSVNIEERQQAEQRQLELVAERERTAALNEFVEYASHDFKTPLSIINTSLHLLKAKKDEDPVKHQQRIATLEAQAARISNILDSMMEMLHLDREQHIALTPCPLNRVLENIFEHASTWIDGRSIVLVRDFPPDLPVIQVSEPDLHRAVLNLIDNAINYTPPGSQITLRADVADGQVHIEVSDTGYGIDAVDLPHIFDRFYRGEKERPLDSGISGLGLSITQKIVELHGGTISVSSQPGQGTRFVITLPVPAPSAAG
jgi:signal transduction histidine kinase